jgi:hypothetical protein
VQRVIVFRGKLKDFPAFMAEQLAAMEREEQQASESEQQ